MRVYLLIGLGLWMGVARGQDLKVLNARCEHRVNPSGIEQAAPILSWELQSSKKGILQTAYRVLVSEDSSVLQSDAGAIWDSKRLLSDESIRVRYNGARLRSGSTYYWKVMVWDNKGDSSHWSGIGRWQMGLPLKQDWKGAQWIGYEAIPDSALRLPGSDKKGGPLRDTLPVFRKEIHISKTLKRATAFVSGLGHFEMSLNGQKVGDHFLDPGWTTYDKVAMYVPFDITKQLNQGVNAIGVMLGNGFYYVPRERYHKLTVAYGYPKLIARIVLEYEDGNVENVCSDASWKTAPGPLTYSSMYGGEDYDARRVQVGWDRPGFIDAAWRQSLVVTGPPALKAQSEEPLKVFEQFAPRHMEQRAADTLVYDLGQNASGIVELQVRGGRGKKVRIVPAELLTADGAANQKATGKPFYYEYTLNGDGAIETWQPRFSYYGFRYVQVEGAVAEGQPNPSGLPVIAGIKGLHTRNAAERDGHFSCSSELFRRTDTLIDWAVQSNLASVLTDCPHREKLGWLEEAHLMGSALRYNYNIATIYQKIIHDMMDAQTESGLIPEIAPEFTQFYEPFRDSPEWASSSILVPWYLYQWYGDRTTLEESYPMMVRYLAYLSTKAAGHLLYQGLGDWYDLGPKDPGVSQLTPAGLTASAIYYYDCRILSQIAAIIGKTWDAKKYADTAAVIKKAFNGKFFNKVSKQYGSGSQTANAMAVYMGLVEPGDKAAVVENIVRDVRAHNNSLTAGDIGYRYLLKVLDDEGRSDVIFDMNSRNDVPGYGYQLAKGATALTESWAGLTSVSNNHFMLGHIMEWFYTGLAGIRAVDSVPGFRSIVLRPGLVGDIHWAGADYHSPYGMIGSHWQKEGNTFDWNISIPGNAGATVYLPVPEGAVVTEGWRALAMRKDVVVLRREKGQLVLRIGSGSYNFRVKQGNAVSEATMKSVYEEVKTPYKYGLVMTPADNTKMLDCPTVFRKGDRWFMSYIIFDGRGYETWLAESKDLLHWETKGKMMSFGDSAMSWDGQQRAGYVGLQDNNWEGGYELQPYQGKYWMSYIGGNTKGYEAGTLSIGMAYTEKDPSVPHEWQRLERPVLTPKDSNVGWWDNHILYKSTIMRDEARLTKHPFLMYYNANGDSVNKKRGAERIGMAVSDDMVHWMRPARDPLLDHLTGITGDPYLRKIGKVWVMFYFGAFWKNTGGAFNRFACSYDLVNWTDWTGPDLIEPSEPYDEVFAHKSLVVKYKGIVYHFYCAVDKQGRRGIAVATSVDKGKSSLRFDEGRTTASIDTGWHFFLGDVPAAREAGFDDGKWRQLDLPHDWSIEGSFNEKHSTGPEEGGLPAGIGWYRRELLLGKPLAGKKLAVAFDGIYRNSEVWINGHFLGKRPNGYISFQYDITPWLADDGRNILSVRVDNSAQPNSRWYSGSGIYRHVWLVTTGEVAIDRYGTFVTAPEVSYARARVHIKTAIRRDHPGPDSVRLETTILDQEGHRKGNSITIANLHDSLSEWSQDIEVATPRLWFPADPYLYRVRSRVFRGAALIDEYYTPLGIRSFRFDAAQGFILNGEAVKIKGVCMHHDLGALGAAVNTRAIVRELSILKAMGCNGIRTAHNPPAPELLDACDRMGFIVMDEAFDQWKKKKNKYDYSLDFADWHARDLEDQVRRDRNHPSVFIWSIGNEIREQFDSSGISIARELAGIVRSLDTTRPVTSALTEADPAKNYIYRSGALDLLGFNYHQEKYEDFARQYPGERFVAAETMSALETRGHYDMPSDSVRRWPAAAKAPLVGANPDWTVSAYDNVSAYWGSTHEETWKVIKRNKNLSGLYIWTGFDYLGEPTPYPWPARSSYFGIVDLAGIPKDVYYMYQSEWTDYQVLHIFPHWNWRTGQTVDVWAYYNQADEVELYLNGRSLGKKHKEGEDLHVQWRVVYEPGELKAISRKGGKLVLERVLYTAGKPAAIGLSADRDQLTADGCDLSYITVTIKDAQGHEVPVANNKLHFEVSGEGRFAGADNGYQASLVSFGSADQAAFNGRCVGIVRTTKKAGVIVLRVTGNGLTPAEIKMVSK